MKELKREFLLVTPAIAAELLKNNNCNRILRPAVIADYAGQMARGEWRENTPERLLISPSGRLLNGQHRLHAVVESGITFTFEVAYNVPEDMFDIIDRGARRTPGDILSIAGVKNPILTAAIIVKFLNMGKKATGYATADKPSMKQIRNEYDNRPKFWDHIVDFANNSKKSFGGYLEPSLLGSWYALCSDISVKDADRYFAGLTTGLGFTNEKDPICQYRQYLLKNREEKHLHTALASTKLALFIKSWNMMRDQKLKSLRYSPKVEIDFPVLK